MATSRKKKQQVVQDDTYNELEVYCIWLNEYYGALVRAGFKTDVALTVMMDKTSYPDWVSFKLPSEKTIADYLDDEDED